MAYSDYLEIKKNLEIKKKTNINIRCSSSRTKNNQFLHLQNVYIINEDGEVESKTNRFNITLPKTCNLYSRYNNKLASNFSFMYSIPKIHIPEYEKNKYQPAFCWTCYTPVGEITNYIACSVCDQGPSCADIKKNADEQQSMQLIDVEIIDKVMDEYDKSQQILDEVLDEFIDDYDYDNGEQTIHEIMDEFDKIEALGLL